TVGGRLGSTGDGSGFGPSPRAAMYTPSPPATAAIEIAVIGSHRDRRCARDGSRSPAPLFSVEATSPGPRAGGGALRTVTSNARGWPALIRANAAAASPAEGRSSGDLAS